MVRNRRRGRFGHFQWCDQPRPVFFVSMTSQECVFLLWNRIAWNSLGFVYRQQPTEGIPPIAGLFKGNRAENWCHHCRCAIISPRVLSCWKFQLDFERVRVISPKRKLSPKTGILSLIRLLLDDNSWLRTNLSMLPHQVRYALHDAVISFPRFNSVVELADVLLWKLGVVGAFVRIFR